MLARAASRCRPRRRRSEATVAAGATMPSVIIQKLTATDGFIAFDLDDAPAAGVVRSAPKILVDGASLLARSLTYRFATFERKVGGASAGVNAAPDDRAAALAAFATEVEPLVRDGRLAIDPAKGVAPADLEPLRDADPRPEAYATRHDELAGLGVAVAAHTAVRGLAGRRVAIEGFDAAGPAAVAGIVSRGGKVVAISTADGTATSAEGFDEATVASAWAEHGTALISQLAEAPGKAWEVFGVPADVLVVGSKPGVIDDSVAA